MAAPAANPPAANPPAAKPAVVSYEIECKDVKLDQTTVTSDDINKTKQFATSYTTAIYDIPGSLTAKEFKCDNDGKLLSITFDIVASAKQSKDKTKLDPAVSYTATVKAK